MARVRVRLELPPDLAVSDDEVRAAVVGGLEDAIEKSHKHDEPKRLPPYPQSLVNKTQALYERQAERMVEEIADVLSS